MTEKALDIYQSLFEEVFEGDNLMWNPDIVSDYTQLLMKLKEYNRAIEAKKTLIKHLKKEGTVDHQIRRAWLEIICIQIIAEDVYRIENSLYEFGLDCQGGNPYAYDEYNIACSLNDAILNKDYKALLTVTKKPIFSFIEGEVVKPLKLLAMNPPKMSVSATATTEDQQKNALDNMLL